MAETAAQTYRRPVAVARHPVTPMLLPVPIVCFIGALINDLVYANSAGNLLYLNFSSWLLVAGLLFGALAGILLLIDTVRRVAGWAPFALLLAAWIVELINSFVHARDGWTAVVPLGLILSVVAAILALACGWAWQSFRYRREEVAR
jgi:uncharacterized membrane protein